MASGGGPLDPATLLGILAETEAWPLGRWYPESRERGKHPTPTIYGSVPDRPSGSLSLICGPSYRLVGAPT